MVKGGEILSVKDITHGHHLDENDIRLIISVAERYYEFGQTQQEIADQLGISRPKVSRLLTRARQEGIVQISIVNPFSREKEVARELVEKYHPYGLKDAVVVPTSLREDALIAQKLGQVAASYLCEHLSDGEVVGIGRGRTIYEMVKALPEREFPNVQIVPLSGGLGQADARFQVNEMAHRAAEKLRGRCVYLYAPAIVESQQSKKALYSVPHIRKAVQLWDHLDWAIVGIGSIDSPHNAEYFQVMKHLIDVLDVKNAVGDICLWHFDFNGSFCKGKHDILISITPEQLKRSKKTVAVAGGAKKVGAIAAALKGGIVSVVVTDEYTARKVLETK